VLLALERKDAKGKGEFEAVRTDIARSSVAAGTDVKVNVPQSDIVIVEKLANAGDASDALLLGWYFLPRENATAAEKWFRKAYDKEQTAVSAEGLGLSLLALNRAADAEAVLYDWRGTSDETKSDYLAAVANVLAASPPPQIAPEILQRMVAEVYESRDATAAQQLGWYADGFYQYLTAEKWFTKALEWKPDDEPSAYGLALMRWKMGDYAGVQQVQAAWVGRSERIPTVGQPSVETAALPGQQPGTLVQTLPPGYAPQVIQQQGVPQGFPQQAAPFRQQQAAPTYQQQVAPAYQQQVAPPYPQQPATVYPQQQVAPAYRQQAAPAYTQQQGAPAYPPQQVAPAYRQPIAPAYPPQPQAAPAYRQQGAPQYPPQQVAPAPQAGLTQVPLVPQMQQAPPLGQAAAPQQLAPAAQTFVPEQQSGGQAQPRTRRGGCGSAGTYGLTPANALTKAWCLMEAKRPIEAAQAFERALEGPERIRSEAAYGQSLAYMQAGLSDKAAISATKGRLDNKRATELRNQLLSQQAVNAYENGRYNEALIALDERAQIFGEQNDLLVLRGYSYLQLRRYSEAEQVFRASAMTGNRDALRGLSDVRGALEPRGDQN
jgi:cellulose synthase operon protein C